MACGGSLAAFAFFAARKKLATSTRYRRPRTFCAPCRKAHRRRLLRRKSGSRAPALQSTGYATGVQSLAHPRKRLWARTPGTRRVCRGTSDCIWV